MNSLDINEPLSEELDKNIRATRGADSEGGTAKPLETEPTFTDERTGIMAGFGIKPA